MSGRAMALEFLYCELSYYELGYYYKVVRFLIED